MRGLIPHLLQRIRLPVSGMLALVTRVGVVEQTPPGRALVVRAALEAVVYRASVRRVR